MKNVLIVDDIPMNLTILEKILILLNCKVYKFQTPAACLKWAEKNMKKIDLAIIDFQMPLMNGNDLAISLRKRGCKKNIVILTSMTELISENLDEEAKITTIINKPTSLKSIKHLLNRWLELETVVDSRRDLRVPDETEAVHEIFQLQNGHYKSLHVYIINRSKNGLGFKIRTKDAGTLATGNEVIMNNGLNYSVVWSNAERHYQCVGLSRV